MNKTVEKHNAIKSILFLDSLLILTLIEINQ